MGGREQTVIEEMQEEIDALRFDKRRLDFLESSGRFINPYTKTRTPGEEDSFGYQGKGWHLGGLSEPFSSPTLRELADKGMEHKGQGHRPPFSEPLEASE